MGAKISGRRKAGKSAAGLQACCRLANLARVLSVMLTTLLVSAFLDCFETQTMPPSKTFSSKTKVQRQQRVWYAMLLHRTTEWGTTCGCCVGRGHVPSMPCHKLEVREESISPFVG